MSEQSRLYPAIRRITSMAFAAAALFLGGSAIAQTQQADRIIVKVGKNRIILESELNMNFNQYRSQNPEVTDSFRCTLLREMIFEKILAEQAERDSVIVQEEEIEANLDQRMRYYIQQAGGQERFEQYMGKTVFQIKDDNRDVIREQLTAERMRGQILTNVKITPSEVKRYFDKIPTDSLPYMPATVEVGQIVIEPPVSPELDNLTRSDLEKIRKDIVEGGKSFEAMAGLYSIDPGSRDEGGDLGFVERGQMVPEFEKAGFRLQNGEVSQIVKSDFGYHLIKLESRQGDKVHLRHILMRPQRTSADFKLALAKLDSVRAELISGKTSFQLAVGKYSTDKSSKTTGGMISSQNTGSTKMQIQELDPQLVLALDSIQVGGFSAPQVFVNPATGEKSCRIIYLKDRTQPHKANMVDDYGSLQNVALRDKQMEKMNTWLAEKLPSYYLKIDKEYQNCPELAPWVAAINKKQ